MDAERSRNSINLILNYLTDEDFEKISPKLRKVELVLGDVLIAPGQMIEKVYFPETSVISIVTLLENGVGVESGIIGREGLSGSSVILTDKEAFSEATVQLSGTAYEMDVEDFKFLFDDSEVFRSLVYKYIHAFISQISQNAACLSFHTIEKRLARWLLMFYDRSERQEMNMTQEFIAQMLGVHRPSVSKNAKKLQNLGLINYNRGVIEILDKEGLRNFSCECYKTINNALSRYISLS